MKALRFHFTGVSCLCAALAAAAFGVAAVPAVAQDDSLEVYKARLPRNTIFYGSLDNMSGLAELRETNPMHRFIYSPEMKENWDALKSYLEEMIERNRPGKRPPGDAASEQGKKSFFDEIFNFDEEGKQAIKDLGAFTQNSLLYAVVLPHSAGEIEEGKVPSLVVLYDITGNEQVVDRLLGRILLSGYTEQEYEFEGLTVIETLDKNGKGAGYRAQIGRWLAAGTGKVDAEDWFRRVQGVVGPSLGDSEVFRTARNYRDGVDQHELFFNVAFLTELIQSIPLPPDWSEENPTPPQITEALGLTTWEFVAFSYGMEADRTRYTLDTIYRPGAVAADARFLVSEPGVSFDAIALAPVDALDFSASREDFSTVWLAVEEGIEALVPRKEKVQLRGAQGMPEGMLGVSLGEVIGAFGPEYASVSYVGDSGDPVRVSAVGLRNREVVLTLIRNAVTMAGPFFPIEEVAGEGDLADVSYFPIVIPDTFSGEPTRPYTVLAVADDWLLFSDYRVELDATLRRIGTSPTLADSPLYQAVRERLPQKLSGVRFSDSAGLIERADLESFLNKVLSKLVTDINVRLEEEARAGNTSSEGNGPDEAVSSEPPGPGESAEGSLDPNNLLLPPPWIKIPRDILKWSFSGTWRDAAGVHLVNYIE